MGCCGDLTPLTLPPTTVSAVTAVDTALLPTLRFAVGSAGCRASTSLCSHTGGYRTASPPRPALTLPLLARRREIPLNTPSLTLWGV